MSGVLESRGSAGAARTLRLAVSMLVVLSLTAAGCEKLVGIEPVVIVAAPDAGSGADGGDSGAGRAFLGGTCTGPAVSTTFRVDGPRELIVLAHYEPANPGANEVSVVVSRGRSIVLALTAYSATTWNVSLVGGARVEEVLLLQGTGGEMSSLRGLSGVPQSTASTTVEDPSMEANLVAITNEAARRTGAPLGGYFGCYAASAYDVSDAP